MPVRARMEVPPLTGFATPLGKMYLLLFVQRSVYGHQRSERERTALSREGGRERERIAGSREWRAGCRCAGKGRVEGRESPEVEVEKKIARGRPLGCRA